MKDILPFSCIIQIGDITLTCSDAAITLEDQIDQRTETKKFKDDVEAILIVLAFLQMSGPGSAFEEAFPFWC